MRSACAATAFVAVLVLSSSVALVPDQAHRAEAGAPAGSALLWRVPEDIGSRNLYYGAGDVENRPRGGVTFIEEDLNGTNPKLEVRDQPARPVLDRPAHPA